MEKQDMLLSNIRRLKRDSLFHLNDVKELEKNCEGVFSEDIDEARALYQKTISLFKEFKNKIPHGDEPTTTLEFLALKLKLNKLYRAIKEKCEEHEIIFY